jgi:hypothetical protein
VFILITFYRKIIHGGCEFSANMKIPCDKPQGIFVGLEIYYTGGDTPAFQLASVTSCLKADGLQTMSGSINLV